MSVVWLSVPAGPFTAAEAAGAVLSILTAGEVNVALLPARSVTVTVPVTAFPSADRTRGPVGLAGSNPERLSLAVKGIETSVLFQPAALGGGLGEPKESVGGLLSMRTVRVCAGSSFPALSRAK